MLEYEKKVQEIHSKNEAKQRKEKEREEARQRELFLK